MIGKRWQSMWNLAKARLGDPWRDGERVYCLDDKTAKTKESVGLACKAIHRSDRLPWPSENCIIGSEGWPFADVLTIVARHGATDKATIMMVMNAMGGPQFVMIDTADFEHVVLPHTLSLEDLGREASLFDGLAEGRTTQQFADLLSLVYNFLPVQPIQAFWRGKCSKRMKYEDGIVGVFSAFLLVFALANRATPCAYRVTARMRNGYGKPSLKKYTRGCPELILASFERIYHHMKSEDGNGPIPEPYKRHGHYRYFWKRAGLNRLTLPRRAVDRLALVFKHDVESIYINPCWVGPRKWRDGDGDYEVHIGPEPG